MMGVFDAALTEPIAKVLASLGACRAMVVHADDALDEISTTSETQISELKDGEVRTRRVRPEDFGMKRAKMDDLLVDSAGQSAQVIRDILGGAKGPSRDMVVLNAAAALAVADQAETIAACLGPAERSIDTGAAMSALDKLIEVSNS